MSANGTASDCAAAREIAAAAGTVLLEIRAGLARGADVDSIRREGDRQSHELIVSLLAERYPDDAIVSEESPGGRKLGSAERVWIVDPLDGTREFGELGRTDWAVHVALVDCGHLAAGAVAMPARTEVPFASDSAPSPPPAAARPPRLVVSRTRPAAEAVALAERLGGELVPMGSAGAKVMAVLSGEADLYVHSGGQHTWDSAAPVAVAIAAGVHASRIDGSPLDYGSDETWLPDLLVCRQDLRDRVLAELQSCLG